MPVRLLVALVILACGPTLTCAQLFDGDNGVTIKNSIPHIDTSAAHFVTIASSLSCTGDSDGRVLVKTGTPSVWVFCDANDALAYLAAGDASGYATGVKGSAEDLKRFLSVQDNTGAIDDSTDMLAGWTHLFPMASEWYYCAGSTVPCVPVHLLGDKSTAAGDILVRNATDLTPFAVGAAATGSVLSVSTSAAQKVTWRSTLFYMPMIGTGNCGIATGYLGGSGGCNATESNVASPLNSAPVTVTSFTCNQTVDTTCVVDFQLRRTGGDVAGWTCSTTNIAACTYSTGTAAYAATDTIDIKLVDHNTTWTDTISVVCAVYGTSP